MAAQNAFRAAVEKLGAIMAEGPREYDPDLPTYNTDLDAAKTLAKLSLDAMKLCRLGGKVNSDGSAGPPGSNPDLFDLKGVYGYWQLKDPNQI